MKYGHCPEQTRCSPSTHPTKKNTVRFSHLVNLFVTRHRRRGAIEITLVRPCVRPSVRSCPRNSSYGFHRTDLKFYSLPSYHMKMCMWFLIFVWAIFNEVMAVADSYLVQHFIKWTQELIRQSFQLPIYPHTFGCFCNFSSDWLDSRR